MSDVLVEVRDQVGLITLNRPERRNAFTLGMVDAWADAIEAHAQDDEIHAILVRGADGNFCSGVDLADFSADPRTPVQEKSYLQQHVHRVARALQATDKPVIAAVDGFAIGAGMDMALLCDIRFASPRASFSEGYIKVGLVPGDGGAWLLPRIVGKATALRLLWTGEVLDADQALNLGIVEEVVDNVDERALEFARLIAAKPPFTIRAIKRLVNQGLEHDLQTALDLVSSHFAIVRSMNDSREAMAAVREHRTPRFEGI